MAQPRPTTNTEVCAIVVSYNPDSGFVERLDLLLAQFPEVFIIDNASSTGVEDLAAEKTTRGRINFIRNTENLGIGKALNIGVSMAISSGYSWAVTFDQDTRVFDSLLASLIRVSKTLGRREVLVGSNYADLYKESDQKEFLVSSDCDGVVEKTTLITSGMLVPLHFVTRIGGFREDYFIDSVDHEFCLRASRYGARVVRTKKLLMEHSIGEPGGPVRFSRKLSSHHSPARKYFISRNALLTIKEHGLRHPIWATRQIFRILAEAVGIAIFERNKKSKLLSLFRGIKDALMNKRA